MFLWIIQDGHMVSFIMSLISGCSFKLRTRDEQLSHIRQLCNGMPQGLTLFPTLLNIYISDLLQTTLKKYDGDDDLPLPFADKTWEEMEVMLNQNRQALHDYLECWRLNLSTENNTTIFLYLNNNDIRCSLISL